MGWSEAEAEAFGLNRASWDERVAAHWESQMYRRHAEALRAGGHCIGGELVDLTETADWLAGVPDDGAGLRGGLGASRDHAGEGADDVYLGGA